jgi:hypothetical protein
MRINFKVGSVPPRRHGSIYIATTHENKTHPDFRGFFAPFSTWFDSKILYALDENAVPNRGATVICKFSYRSGPDLSFSGKNTYKGR